MTAARVRPGRRDLELEVPVLGVRARYREKWWSLRTIEPVKCVMGFGDLNLGFLFACLDLWHCTLLIDFSSRYFMSVVTRLILSAPLA